MYVDNVSVEDGTVLEMFTEQATIRLETILVGRVGAMLEDFETQHIVITYISKA
ncbi:hypothetical protein [Haloarchaeobius sp. HME9146]|uniref:hypothetical protein n=1 Tax=Haloarchaeobius sp. HME9146 TaxID=2978732 RepID=UPI0021BF45F4|nr:hypothetical protein [Haloarchaeobius sp. HME9146]MCT9098174.1 hypothetical protein [Haloarchaeobius sp. HME9146]